MKKKMISACFASIIAASITVASDAEFTETVNGVEWTYRVVGGEAVLGGNNGASTISTSTFGAITIPDTLGGCAVAVIGDGALRDCNALTLITIPDGVKHIGNDAFRGCSGLMTLAIPNGVTNIGARAFYGAGNITKIVIPDSVIYIGGEAFNGCGSLRSFTIPTKISVIEDRLFEWCSFPSIDIPYGVTRIGNMAFSWGTCCSEHISIPDSVVEICDEAFAHGGVKDVTIPGSVRKIGVSVFDIAPLTNVVLRYGVPYVAANMFSRCHSLTDVTMADSISMIGSSAFSGCSKLKNPVLPSALNTIGNNAFQGCSTITEIVIPTNVQIVGGYAFKDCTNLKSVKFLGNAPIADEITFENVNADCTAYVSRSSTGWAVDIPGKWLGINIDYFDPAIYTVAFDANGGSLGDAAEEMAFGEGEKIKSLPVPVREGYVFVGWYTDISGDTKVDEGTAATSSMTLYAHWQETVPVLTVEDGVLVSVALNGATSIVIPDGVRAIADNAFVNCNELEDISIPNSVESIPFAAFGGCDKLWTKWYKALANVSSHKEVNLSVTNVVMHYVTQSMPSEAVTPPTNATGFVSVIAEVTSGGPVAIASTWAEQYPGFEAKFGSDFTAALTKQVGKLDGSGRPMMVWQDFVAGTDPTNPDDKFTASITFDAQGKPVISYSPELSATETAKRIYRKFGKVKLNDENWIPIANGEEVNYNFFKVTVEMK